MTSLIVNTGGMFSGKSTALLQQGERHILAGKRVVYVKPNIDDRYSENEIVTHSGDKVTAMNCDCSKTLPVDLLYYEVVLIDEVQFFSKKILRDIDYMLRAGITVIVAGLDMDFKGTPFEVTMRLMAVADKVIKHKAVCELCGEDAMYSYRKNSNKDIVALGEKDSYMPLCRKCMYRLTKTSLLGVK